MSATTTDTESSSQYKQLIDLGYPEDVVKKQLKRKQIENEKQIKHDEAVKYGLEIMRKGFVKVDHFDNIYRLNPKFEGAPNLRQVSGFEIYGTGQPNKSAILSLLNIWFKEMKLNKCLWINMRSEPVIYVKDISLSPRDPKHASENIDFGEEGIITIDDLNLFNRELEKTVKQNIDNDENKIFKYHKDTYAPLPADRKDRILEFQCKNGSNDVYGLQSLYNNFKEKDNLNIELQRITVLDEKAPEPQDIVKMVDVITKKTDNKTVIIFNCMMGKGRTTEGMIIACLIKQILQKNKNDIDIEEEEKKDNNNNKWPNDVPSECEEVVSFEKKLKKKMSPKIVSDENKNDNNDDMNKLTKLSVDDMRNGNFGLIKKLINILTNEYKLDGNKIKKETDDIIDRCQHLQNMRECIYLSLRRYIAESRQNEKVYWKQISKQYLQRYYVLIAFNAYLNDVIIKQNKTFDDINYIKWITKRSLIYNIMGKLSNKDSAIAKFEWN